MDKLGQDRKPFLTLSCKNSTQNCNFQFWSGSKESFFCNLDQCQFRSDFKSNRNTSSITCSHIECGCIPDRLLCRSSEPPDLSEWFPSEDGPKGPAQIDCVEPNADDPTRKCTFSGNFDSFYLKNRV